MKYSWKARLGGFSCSFVCLLLQAALGEQIPFKTLDEKNLHRDSGIWDLYHQPDNNSTSQWIFDTVNSFMKLWPNTRLRNGHNLVAGIIPIGTLLYHGTTTKHIPDIPEWTAVDPEHSYVFCRIEQPAASGCWHLTLVVNRPLKVLYFDGSGAAKMPGGSMDSQDLVAWGKIDIKRWFDDRNRITDLCEWAKDRDIQGFVRMEMDFEVMLCDFTVNVEVISFLNLHTIRGIPGKRSSPIYPVLESGKWHDQFPSEQRIRLDYSRIISFYDTSLFPGLQTYRLSQERWDHRLKNISSDEIATLQRTLDDTLKGEWGVSKSGVDWPTLLVVVEQRYNERLALLRYILTDLLSQSDRDLGSVLIQAHDHLQGMLLPYLLESVFPSTARNRTDTLTSTDGMQWAAPTYQQCATVHTQYLLTPTLFSTFTHSEKLLLGAVQDTEKEICRVIVGMWAEGVGLRDDQAMVFDGNATRLQDVADSWKNRTERLMNWLDWSYWATCKPACSYEEVCYLPTWPFFKHRPFNWPSDRRPPISNSTSRFDEVPGDLPEPGPDDDWYHPSPRCIRRLEPFTMFGIF